MKNKYKVALGTYELPRKLADDISHSLLSVGYVDTAISYYNEDEIRTIFSNNLDAKIISKIAPQMGLLNYDLFIDSHISELGKVPDIMLIHNNRCDWMPTAIRLNQDSRFNHIGVSNFTIEDLEKYNKEFNKYPEYIEFEFNPQYTNVELINFCKDKGIKIIAYCILGGKYNSSRYISAYTLKGLIQYAAKYSDIFILRGDNIDQLSRDLFIVYDVIENIDGCNIELVEADSKSIIPMTYLPQKMVGMYESSKLITFDLYSDKIIPIPNKVTDEILSIATDEFDDILTNTNLEFITDLRAYLFYKLKYHYGRDVVKVSNDRYLGDYNFVREFIYDRHNKIYYDLVIIDENDRFSKIVTKGCRIKVLKYQVSR